jgi:hypothetical protein
VNALTDRPHVRVCYAPPLSYLRVVLYLSIRCYFYTLHTD